MKVQYIEKKKIPESTYVDWKAIYKMMTSTGKFALLRGRTRKEVGKIQASAHAALRRYLLKGQRIRTMRVVPPSKTHHELYVWIEKNGSKAAAHVIGKVP